MAEMMVNELPVLTYRFLDVNGSVLEIPDGMRTVKVTHGTSKEKAAELVSASFSGTVAGKIPDVAPNGDTTGRHREQIVRTGMGTDADALFDDQGVEYTLIETAAKENAARALSLAGPDAEDSGRGVMTLARYLIHLRKDSSMSVVLEASASADVNGAQVIFLLERGAQLTLSCVLLPDRGGEAQAAETALVSFLDIGGICMEDAKATLIQTAVGTGTTDKARAWTGVHVDLSGDRACFDGHAAALVSGSQNYDHNYVVVQRGRETSSKMTLNGVLMDNAGKCFRGTIDFRAGSSGSQGDEQEDVLLLSPEVVNRTMPVILCQEEDVDGRHGATVGDLAEDVLFYMASRGISEEEARRLIIRARLMSVARMIPDESLIVRIEQRLREEKSLFRDGI